MPTVAEIRAAIKTKLDAVAGIGKVNDYERYAKDASRMQALYVDGATERLNGCFVAHRATDRLSQGLGRYTVTHRWELRFFRSLDDVDATEKSFDTLLETVAGAFQTDENLGGLISSTVIGEGDNAGPAGVQIEEKNAVLFCGVLCHAARGTLFTRHYE